MDRVKGKVALVTGGAKGIGAATAKRLAEEGATVAVTDVDDDAGQAVVRDIVDAKGGARYWHLDVANPEAVDAVVKEVVAEFGGLDVLVNNAGVSGVTKPPHEITPEEWRQVIDINVNGVFYCTRAALGPMREKGAGSVVNLSSIYGLVGAPDLPPYHASKGAVRLMTKTDALFYAKEGIRVNSVHPGYIWTPLVADLAERQGLDPEDFKAELGSRHPVGHVGEPDDIANGVLFLASDESKFMTGSELVIDGGYTAQ